ncbi:MAG: DeoR/GlpR family DNA-binding transcription regulator [Lachnospiraceae bacterium]|nr:DeoR/GlpR family DNA-binding transcription regulator [Lachnospiraceae bacterium]
MYQEERISKILQWLQKEDVLSNQDIMRRLNISRDTARRDIIKIVESGKAVRTHGGIAGTDILTNVGNYQMRKTDNVEGKRRIGKEAAKHLKADSICFFDTSTHMPYVCSELGRVQVYTHSLDNLELLAAASSAEVHSLGGKLHRENRFFYGTDTVNKIRNMNFDIALLGAASVKEDGIYYVDEEDALMKSLAADRSDRVIVMADYPKFQRKANYRGLSFDQIDMLITDQEMDDKWKETLKKEYVEWIIV